MDVPLRLYHALPCSTTLRHLRLYGNFLGSLRLLPGTAAGHRPGLRVTHTGNAPAATSASAQYIKAGQPFNEHSSSVDGVDSRCEENPQASFPQPLFRFRTPSRKHRRMPFAGTLLQLKTPQAQVPPPSAPAQWAAETSAAGQGWTALGGSLGDENAFGALAFCPPVTQESCLKLWPCDQAFLSMLPGPTRAGVLDCKS